MLPDRGTTLGILRCPLEVGGSSQSHSLQRHPAGDWGGMEGGGGSTSASSCPDFSETDKSEATTDTDSSVSCSEDGIVEAIGRTSLMGDSAVPRSPTGVG